MFPTKTARKWPFYLAATAFLIFAIRAPQEAAEAIRYVAASLSEFTAAL